MGHQWIIGVLEDLRSYAALNGLTALAAALEQTGHLARQEIATAGARAADAPAVPAGEGGWAQTAGLGRTPAAAPGDRARVP